MKTTKDQSIEISIEYISSIARTSRRLTVIVFDGGYMHNVILNHQRLKLCHYHSNALRHSRQHGSHTLAPPIQGGIVKYHWPNRPIPRTSGYDGSSGYDDSSGYVPDEPRGSCRDQAWKRAPCASPGFVARAEPSITHIYIYICLNV